MYLIYVNFVDTDNKVTRKSVNKRTVEEIETVHSHINFIPTYYSHNTRKDSQKKYLPGYLINS